jgi:hypothetical protein
MCAFAALQNKTTRPESIVTKRHSAQTLLGRKFYQL